ncbi:hypothetical protein [Sphingomonas sp. 22176]|uniref:hypothetical protein n=1 Tax=Sphingomonas sp. 22176 TaxID=3453884 RepID=UPI003F82C774
MTASLAAPYGFAVIAATALPCGVSGGPRAYRVRVPIIPLLRGLGYGSDRLDFRDRLPQGNHLVSLVRHSDQVLGAILTAAGRGDLRISLELNLVRTKLLELAALLECA